MFASLLAAMGLLAALAPQAVAAGDANAAACPTPTEESPGFRTYLPDCRAYELVSPAFKEGHPVLLGGGGAISLDGSHLLVGSLGAFAGTEDLPGGPSVSGAAYELSRTSAGWITTSHSPPPSLALSDFGNVRLASTDLTRSTFFVASAASPVSQDLYIRMENGSFVLISPLLPPAFVQEVKEELTSGSSPGLSGASSDLSDVLLTYRGAYWPGDTTQAGATSLYQASLAAAGAEPKLVGIRNSAALASNTEAELISQCGTVLGGGEGSGAGYLGAVSADGQAIFFTAGECFAQPGEPKVNELYARLGSVKTLAISSPTHPLAQGAGSGPEECNAACEAAAPAPGVFQGASSDGSKVFFSTNQPLLNSDSDTTADLYEAQIEGQGSAATLSKIIQISKGDSSDPTPGTGAHFLGILGSSADGSRVYIAAEGILTTNLNSQGQKAVAGVPNLYLVEPASGRTVFVASLSPEDQVAENGQVTSSGRFLAFRSHAHLTSDDTGAGSQLFEFDAQTEDLERVSIGQRGSYECPATGIVEEGFNCNGNSDGNFVGLGSEFDVISDDGAVFFNARTALTPKAFNDPEHVVRNVYEYRDGNVYLISDGEDATTPYEESSVRFIGVDSSGQDAFFETADPLVPSDGDTQADIYDARIDGGFPASLTPPRCEAESCQGAIPTAPTAPSPGSSTFAGPPNEAGKHKGRRPHRKTHHKKSKRDGHDHGGDK